jgi:FHA domain-containing protein
VTTPDVSETAKPADALALLDYRTLRQALKPELAPPGRYLAFDGSLGTRLIPLRQKTTHIGRGLTADIRLDDHRIARLHAIITNRPEGARLLDGRSADGTLVNGARVLAAELHDGDAIQLGPIAVSYVEVLVLPCHAGRARGQRYPRMRPRASDPIRRRPAPGRSGKPPVSTDPA